MDEREKLGKLGEKRACLYLQRCGYRIVERNFRCRSGEVDIIAIIEKTLCFIEVKTRRNFNYGLPSEAVNERKRHRIRAAASYYMLCHSEYHEYRERLDVIELLFMNQKVYLHHLENAFGEGR